MSKLTFRTATYRGIQCMTPAAYMFITENGKGLWIPKSMTFNLVIHSNDYVTALHPTCMANVEEVPIRERNLTPTNSNCDWKPPYPYTGRLRCF